MNVEQIKAEIVRRNNRRAAMDAAEVAEDQAQALWEIALQLAQIREELRESRQVR